jgi:hypothetical protein
MQQELFGGEFAGMRRAGHETPDRMRTHWIDLNITDCRVAGAFAAGRPDDKETEIE